MQMILAVGAGGALGAIARYLLVSRIGHMIGPNGVAGVPVGILAANVLGSLAMGLLTEYLALVWSPPAAVRAMLSVGVLGAFTTFSTFSLEAGVLLERGDYAPAAAYIAASVGLSLLGLFAGLWIMRSLLT
jgi:CrcB protein